VSARHNKYSVANSWQNFSAISDKNSAAGEKIRPLKKYITIEAYNFGFLKDSQSKMVGKNRVYQLDVSISAESCAKKTTKKVWPFSAFFDKSAKNSGPF
jgi:hypothetical protein